jgi:hypothetical protein
MTNKYLSLLLPLTLTAVLLMTGCGSDESAEAAPSKRQFLERADLICEEAGKEQLGIATTYMRKHPGAEKADFVEPAAFPPLENEVEELKALDPPDGDEEEVTAFLEELEKDLEAAKKEPLSILVAGNNPFGPANKRAHDYGFVDCAIAP